MKPRLPPSPWTSQDEDIVFRHGRGRWSVALRTTGLQSDIHDAHAMYTRECLRVRMGSQWPAVRREVLRRILSGEAVPIP